MTRDLIRQEQARLRHDFDRDGYLSIPAFFDADEVIAAVRRRFSQRRAGFRVGRSSKQRFGARRTAKRTQECVAARAAWNKACFWDQLGDIVCRGGGRALA